MAVGMWAIAHGIVSLLLAQPDFPWPDVDALVDHMMTIQARGVVGP
jgi:hypothetical protein